ARRIDVDVASHHRTVDPILPELHRTLTDLTPMTPTIPLISTTTHPTTTTPTFNADHWIANLRNPVHFHHAITTASTHHATFIEISPHPLLTHAITETVESVRPGGEVRVAATVHRDTDETLTFHTQLATVGPPVTQGAQSGGGAGRLVDLPPTPWLHSRYWLATRSRGPGLTGAHPLLGLHVEMPAGGGHIW